MNHSVLIADDEIPVRQMLSLVMQSLGYETIYEAEDGIGAVQLFNKHNPSIVLLDIRMPAFTGLEALRQIMTSGSKPCVLIISAADTMALVKACIQSGAANYILKNNSPEKIKDIVAQSIQRWQAKTATT